ncbi:MAG: tetratricopeptide repeat protein, partial [Acidobacteriota bacterium]
RLDLAPLDVHGLQAILDRRFAPHALPPELAPALVRYSGGWPALLANAAADLMAAECLRRDDQDVWHLPEGTTSPAFVEIVSSALFDEVDAELARIEDADLRGRVSRFLVLAALCGRYVPLALPFACMGLTKDQGNDVIDWLDEVLAEQLGWMHDMGFGHRFFRGFNVYSFAHPVLPHAILARLAASEYQRAGEAVTLLRFLEHQNVRVAERAMARMFLSIAEHLDPKDREPYERSLEWWISLGGVDALRGALREDLQSGRLDPELLWRIAEGAESWRALPRLALLDAYGEAVLVGSGDEDEGPRLSPDRWFGFHSLRARLLVVDAGRYAEGLAEAERAMALAEGDDVKTSYALWLRGAAKQRVGDYDAARSDLETALDICERLYVGPNLSTSSVQVALAQTLQAQKDYQGAREMTTAALETCRRLLGPEHPETLRVKLNLEAALSASGETDDAQKLALETLEAFVRVLGPEHPSTINAMEIWGRALIGGGNLQGARDLIEPALPVRQRLFGPEHPGTLVTQANLAKVLLAQGELKEARGLAEETLGAMERVLGPEHPEALEIAEVLDEISAAEREASEEN